MTKHIAVLYGGISAEREVSLASGKAVSDALRARGYHVTDIDVTRDVAAALSACDPAIDVVFNALHGRFGEDGTIQGMLEILGIPYTHSGVLASSLAMDKPMAKKVFSQAGLRCAEGVVTTREALESNAPLPRPFVVKPLNEGSSVGVAVIMKNDPLPEGAADEQVLVETYIPGREIQVAVLDDEALGAIEVKPKTGFYDYEAKYSDGMAEHIMPAPLTPEKYEEVCALALRAHQALGCRGLTRSDFRYWDKDSGGDEHFYLLETNTQPGMTPISLSPDIAAHVGIDFVELCDRLVRTARLGA